MILAAANRMFNLKGLLDFKDGWINYFKSSLEQNKLDLTIKELAQKRADICIECPYLRPVGNANKVSNKGIVKALCYQCGCAFPANVFAPNKSCPIKKW